MIVMVEKEEVTGQLNRGPPRESLPGSPNHAGAASPRFTNDKLYTEYLRREGKSSGSVMSGSLPSRTGGSRHGAITEPQPFQDF